ncbi:MAG: hypothetical protein ACYS0K_23030, partial [Planctomycetota bacterium]
MNCIGIVKRTLVIGRPAVLAAALIIAFAADAVAGIHSDSFGVGGDIETRRFFGGSASSLRWEGDGSDVAKYARVHVYENITLGLQDDWHTLVFLDVNSSAKIRQDGTRDSSASVQLEMSCDDVLPYSPADKLEILGEAYCRFSDQCMATTVGTQAVFYRLDYGAVVTLDLVASASLGSDSVV